MSDGITITIYHFDDEPETIDWIPDCLLNYYRLRYPSWVRDSSELEGDEEQESLTFCLHTPVHRVQIHYYIYSRPDLFRQMFKPQRDDIAILDVITEMPGGALEPKGIEFYQEARDHLGLSLDRIYILTAFPGIIKEEVLRNLPADHLMIKPPDATTIIRTIAHKIQPLLV